MWPAWWGGQVASTKPPQISEYVQALRAKIGGLVPQKKEKVPYKVKSGADLMDKLRAAIDELGMIAPVVEQKVEHYVPIEGENRYKEPTTTLVVHVTSRVRLGCPDGSFLDLVGSGHGTSEDDKAGGKASTYAWKDAILKGCSVPEKDMADTDNESTALPAKPTSAKPPVIDMWASAIEKATTLKRLEQIKADMAKLKMETQLALSPAYEARKKLVESLEASEKK